VTPEEYHLLTDFVVRVEDELMARKNAERQVYLEKVEKIREGIPEGAYHVTLAEVGISTRVANLLAEAGYETAGNTLEQLEIDEDKILALQGVGPKAITELNEILPGFDYPEPVVEEELVEEEEEAEPAAEDAKAETEAGAEDAQVEAEGEADAEPAAEADSEAEPEAIPIEEAFKQAIEEVAQAAIETDDDDATEAEKEAERKKRKQRARVVEYDPDLGETVVRHRRKPGRQTDWQDVGEFDDNK
jgi:hypothetical protein